MPEMKVIKNCPPCKHFQYYEKCSYDSTDEEGFFCEKREYRSVLDENRHLSRLQDREYQMRPKKCCVLTASHLALQSQSNSTKRGEPTSTPSSTTKE